MRSPRWCLRSRLELQVPLAYLADAGAFVSGFASLTAGWPYEPGLLHASQGRECVLGCAVTPCPRWLLRPLITVSLGCSVRPLPARQEDLLGVQGRRWDPGAPRKFHNFTPCTVPKMI